MANKTGTVFSRAPLKLPGAVRIVEVGPRDGLQNEPNQVSVGDKVALIDRLSSCGISTIEAGSFVSPKWVPRMADSDEVFERINRDPACRYIMLVVNQKGLERAIDCGAKDIAVFCAASNTFSKKNTHATIDENLRCIERLCEDAQADGIRVRGYLSCVLGCPYEGAVDLTFVGGLAKQLYDFGCEEISLGDTIGVGTPGRVNELIAVTAERVPLKHIAVHFHDTYGQALANVLTAMQMGISVVDCSVAGLGGCPFAPGASGNVATEDVVYMLDGLGVKTGIDLPSLVTTAWFIAKSLKRQPVSKVSLATVDPEFSNSATV